MRRCAWLFGLACIVFPARVEAANALRPRTPPIFEDVACMTVVDKSDQDVLHIDYGVPYDDVELTHDELPDSRRHQFFAFSQQRFDLSYPTWINRSDYDRSEANGDFTREYTDDDILELSSLWPPGTWVRITGDEPRLPITHERAAMGVDWHLDDVPVGTWNVVTYTWEPDNNLWTPRPGAVKIIDSNDEHSGAPAAFLSFDIPSFIFAGDPHEIMGCIDAAPGSTMSAAWGLLIGNDEPEWVPIVDDEPAPQGTLVLPFTPPARAGNHRIKIRLQVEDPSGRSHVAFSPAIRVQANPNAPMDEGGDDTNSGCGGCHVRGERGSPTEALFLVGLFMGLRHRYGRFSASQRSTAATGSMKPTSGGAATRSSRAASANASARVRSRSRNHSA